MSSFSSRGAIRLDGCNPPYLELFASNDETMRSCAERTGASIERYLQRCSATTLQDVDERIARYLRLIPLFMPAGMIMIGQEPYKSSILPAISSAFSFDPSKIRGYTPSVQVLSQFICLRGAMNVRELADILTCSYLLLPHGIICLNVLLSWDLSSYQKQRLQSYFSDLVSDLFMSCSSAGSHRLKVIALGEVACKAIRSSIVSTPRASIGSLKIKASYWMNPVFISRSQDPMSSTGGIRPSDGCIEVEAQMSIAVGREAPCSACEGTWEAYSCKSLYLLGNPADIEQEFSDLSKLGLRGIRQQTIAPIIKHLDASMSYALTPGGAGKPASDGRSNEGVYVNVYKSLQTMVNSGKRIEDEVMSVCERVTEVLGDMDNDESLPVSSLISSLNDLVSSLSVALSFYASMNPALTSTRSAIEMTGPSIPPIIRTRPNEPSKAAREVSFSDILDSDTSDVETQAVKSEHYEHTQAEYEDLYESPQLEEDVLPSEFLTDLAIDEEEGREEDKEECLSLPPRPQVAIG